MGQGNIYFYNSYKKYTELLKVENENKKTFINNYKQKFCTWTKL